MTKQDLLEKKGRLANEAKEILEAAQKDNRESLRKEEEDKFTSIHADIEKITRHIELINKQEDAERSLNDPGQRKADHNPIGDGETRHDSQLTRGVRDHNDAVRGWFLAGAPSAGAVPDRYVQAAKRVGLDLNAKTLTIRMSDDALKPTGEFGGTVRATSDDFKRWQRLHEEKRANAGPQSSTSAGGYVIQDEAMREIEIALLEFGALRRVSTIIRTDKGGPLPIPTVNDTTNVGAIIGEGVTIGASVDLVFGQLVLDAWKYSSKPVLLSVELMQDSAINLQQLLGRLLGERLGRIQNTHFTTGTGTGNPNGVVTAATFAQAATGSATSITYANLIALYHSVDPAYRDKSKWMMNDNSISKIKLMTDSQGRPLWLPGLVDRAPDTILGSPYVINQDMASMTASAKSILFGDFSKYWIRDVKDFTLLRLDERYADFLQVAFLAFMRSDGDLLNAGTVPIRGYQNATA